MAPVLDPDAIALSIRQRRRLPRTLANLKWLPVTDFAVLIDNSTLSGYRVAAFGHKAYMH